MLPPMPQKSLTNFKALSFDCYGTLIDWEAGIYQQFKPLLLGLPSGHQFLHNQHALCGRFTQLQQSLVSAHPSMPYNKVLSIIYSQIAAEEGLLASEEEAARFGRRVGEWGAFPDTVAGLQKLQKHFKLIILSNVDRANMQDTLTGPLNGVHFDAVYTAEEIGSYKPDHKNFTYLLDHLHSDFGLEKGQLLHTAKSLPVDHVPTMELGLKSAWIARGKDGDGVSGMGGALEDFEGRVAFDWRFAGIGAMAEEVEKAFKN